MTRGVSQVDRRVDRSRRQLHTALVALILERGWDRVTVRAVCARAGVGRSTFYVHFADKEDLLIGGIDHVRDDLRDQRRSSSPFGFVRGMIEHADGSRRLFRAVIGKRSGLAVQRRFRQVMLELVTDELTARGIRGARAATASRFLAGALVELLIAWVDGDSRTSPAELEHAYIELAMPVLRTLAR